MNQRALGNSLDDNWQCVEWLDSLVGTLVDVTHPDGEVINSIASFQIIKLHEDEYFVVAIVNTEMPK